METLNEPTLKRTSQVELLIPPVTSKCSAAKSIKKSSWETCQRIFWELRNKNWGKHERFNK